MSIYSDFLVIGSGLAGLTFALRASKIGKVHLITKGKLLESNSSLAQGGIAIPQSEEDIQKHFEDTIKAGDGICDEKIVKMTIEEGRKILQDLVDWGIEFDRENGFSLGLEGGHSSRRILHIKDETGFHIQKKLIERVLENKNIEIFENAMAIDLITKFKFFGRGKDGKEDECFGAYVLLKDKGEIEAFIANYTIVATGGAGKVYLLTSNSDIATGDGIAMCARVGAKIANMEFFQFHPTLFYHPKAKNFLITEALRGEGAKLMLKNGETFMHKYHPMGDLAPRDIVSRAIDQELKKSGDEHILLDATNIPKDIIMKRFSKIYQKCLEFGIDITKDPIPVAPGAHFLCGGVLVDEWGEALKRLFVIGESACTGLHGANRLASNSLLECVVFAKRAFEKISKYELPKVKISAPRWKAEQTIPQDEKILISHTWDEVRRLMSNYVGIVRSNKRLERAYERIQTIKKDVMEDYWRFYPTSNIIELRNIVIVAELIIKCAMIRKESRGTHFNIDYPFKNDSDFKKETLITYQS